VTQTAVEVHGECGARFAPVRDAFHENFERLGEIGAAVAVTIDGRPVIDLWGGHRDRERTQPWERDTITTVYSTTKGLTAVCVHRLVERGLLDVDAPAARYWPEFGGAGKQEVPVRMLLNHTVGLPTTREPMPPEALYDWGAMVAALERSEPFWEPGTRHGYHALTYGWLTGELVRRVSGKSLGTYFRDEVARPLGLDTHIGLAAEHDARVATMYQARLTPAMLAEVQQRRAETLMRMPPALAEAAGNVPLPPDAHNTTEWRRAEIPAANAHSDARSLARLYGALARGGEVDGVRVHSAEAIERATIEQAAGLDTMLGMPTRFALGFWLSVEGGMGPNSRNFGHPGAGGSVGFADPDRGVGFGYVMNQMRQGLLVESTGRRLIEALYSCL